jgi:hypothetical protein
MLHGASEGLGPPSSFIARKEQLNQMTTTMEGVGVQLVDRLQKKSHSNIHACMVCLIANHTCDGKFNTIQKFDPTWNNL